MSGGSLHHAGAAVVGGVGVLVRGPARSGKSALVVSLLRRAEGAGLEAVLLADDQVHLRTTADGLLAVVPATLRGLIEVSGAGILAVPFVEAAVIRLVVDLLPAAAVPRLPETETVAVEGVAVRRVFLPERQAAFGADVVLTLLRARPAHASG